MRRLVLSLGLLVACTAGVPAIADTTLLNVSYDPTRELYNAVNAAFTAQWKAKTGETVSIKQSHGGSGKQARSVIDGLEADVVTLALGYDIDALYEKGGLIPKDWQKRLPEQQRPLHLDHRVRGAQGQPEGGQGLGRSGQARAEGHHPQPQDLGRGALELPGRLGLGAEEVRRGRGQGAGIRQAVFKNVPVLDSGARGSTTTFAQRGIGDVFISWENEAFLVVDQFGKDKFEIVAPSVSILAEPPVTVVDKNASKHGTSKVAEAYLKFLYSDQGQEIIAKNHYRPRNAAVAQKFAAGFPKITLFTIDEVFGGWQKAQKTHFEDNAVYDQVVLAGK